MQTSNQIKAKAPPPEGASGASDALGGLAPPGVDTSAGLSVVFNRIEQIAVALAMAVEAKSPHHLFGLRKLEHCRELALQVNRMAESLGLDSDALTKLKVVALAHDVGRHYEALHGLDTKRVPRHGFDSARILEEEGLPDLLPTGWWQDIGPAIRYHAEASVPLERGTIAHTLCYVLRDLDKLEILSDVEGYFSVHGMLKQIKLHYLKEGRPEADPLLVSNNFDEQAKTAIKHLLHTRPSETRCPSGVDVGLFARFCELMNSTPTEEAIAAFKQAQPLPIRMVFESISNYMLFHLAMVFDMEHRAVRAEVCARGLAKPRWDYLEARMPAQELAACREVWEQSLR